MLRKLKEWRNRRDNKPVKIQLDQETGPGPMPVLPSTRQCIITPSPSREDLRERMRNATSESALFQLPVEVRRLILRAAFGDRTLHMDLFDDGGPRTVLRHGSEPEPVPFEKKGKALASPSSQASRFWQALPSASRSAAPAIEDRITQLMSRRDVPGHAGVMCARAFLKQPMADFLGISESRWAWWGSVCHRDIEKRMLHRQGPVLDPWEDGCTDGFAACNGWAGERPTSCYIGIIGWLLSCRQAYIEGIEVLYGTNTIHMRTVPLVENLSRLLLRQHLDSISSVEMALRIPPGIRQVPRTADRVRKLLESLPSALPNLTHFYLDLNFYPNITLPETMLSTTIGDILVPFDRLVTRFLLLQDCTLGIPGTLWDDLHSHSLRSPGYKLQKGGVACKSDRFWRKLPMTGAAVEGYWIAKAYHDDDLSSSSEDDDDDDDNHSD